MHFLVKHITFYAGLVYVIWVGMGGYEVQEEDKLPCF